MSTTDLELFLALQSEDLFELMMYERRQQPDPQQVLRAILLVGRPVHLVYYCRVYSDLVAAELDDLNRVLELSSLSISTFIVSVLSFEQLMSVYSVPVSDRVLRLTATRSDLNINQILQLAALYFSSSVSLSQLRHFNSFFNLTHAAYLDADILRIVDNFLLGYLIGSQDLTTNERLCFEALLVPIVSARRGFLIKTVAETPLTQTRTRTILTEILRRSRKR